MMKKRVFALLLAAAMLLSVPALAAEPVMEEGEVPGQEAEVPVPDPETAAPETEVPSSEDEETPPEAEDAEESSAEAEGAEESSAEAGDAGESSAETEEAPEEPGEVQTLAGVRTVHASTAAELMGYLTDGASDLEITLDGNKDYVIYSTYTNPNGETYQTGFSVKNLRNVTLRGKAGTRILTPYDCGGFAVITLTNCENVTLDTLSVGHLSQWCQAPVLILNRSAGVEILSCDLWGCGYYGIGCTASSFHAENTTIRDCEGYIMYFTGGTAVFDNCIFRDNGGFDSKNNKFFEDKAIQGAPTSATFNGCQFLRNQNAYKMEAIAASRCTFNNCTETDNGWNDAEPVLESVGPSAQLTLVGYTGTITGIGAVSGIPYRLKSMISELTVDPGITELGDSCFNGCTALWKIALPDTLTKIGNSAFAANSNLDLKELPANVTEIGDSAFNGCHGLTELVIPDGVTAIGASCFNGCTNLRAVSLPTNLKTIGNNAFQNCGKLTAVELPQGLTSVGSEAFYQTGLRELTLPETLTSVGGKAFDTIEDLNHITLPAKGTGLASGFGWYMNIPLVTLTGDGPMREDGSTAGGVLARIGSPYTLELQEGITSISARAFQSVSNMETVRIPRSVTSIGESAFNNCRDLKRAVIAGGVTSIGQTAFTGCSALTEFTFPDTLTSIGDSAFQNCTSLTELVFPEGLTAIGATAFTGCSGLAELTFPNSLTSIGASAFQNCIALTELRIHGNGASIGNSAFSSCSSLASLEIADGVISIGSTAFEGCRALEDVQIAGSVTGIGDRAFISCTCLKRLALSEGLETIGNSAFKVDLTIYKGIAGTSSLALPLSVTSIGESAFEGWNGLRDLSLPVAAQMGNRAFYNCTGITRIVIRGEGNTPDFSGSNSGRPWCATKQPLTVDLENGITGIGKSYFEGAETLCHITIPSTVTCIKEEAFDGSRALRSVSIPAKVNRIEFYAFHNSGLKDVYYGGTEAAWNTALVDKTNSGTRDATIHYNTSEGKYMESALTQALAEGKSLDEAKTALETLNPNSLSRALLESEVRQKLADKEIATLVQAESSSPIPAESIAITGAKVNFPEQKNLALVLTAPEKPEISVPEQGKTLRFSARLVNGETEVPASGLKIPMAVTIRLPDRELSEQSVRVWHSHGETLTELHLLRVDAREDGFYLTFLLDGLSDLIVTYDTGFSLTLSGKTVRVRDEQNTLASCSTIYAARYEGGRLTALLTGTRDGSRITFPEPLAADDVLFFLNEDSKPVREKAPLS